MITAQRTFDYQGRVLIEKFIIEPPYLYDATFQDRGCFIHFKETGPKLKSADSNRHLSGNEAVLLKCGSHFLDLLQTTEDGTVEVVVVHLFPEILKALYATEIPELIARAKHSRSSEVIVSSDLLSKFIESLDFYFLNPSLVNNDLLELKIKELVLLLIQSKNVESIVELIADLYSPRSVSIREIVELHLFSDLKIDQLARLANVSLSTFKRLFKEEYDTSPTKYINERRIVKAQELLSMTDLPITEIAFEVGFQDGLYFSRLFKKKTGMPPSRFRAESKGQVK